MSDHMSDQQKMDDHFSDREDAEAIVAQAARRGLGGRPGLRRLSAVLWAAFLGASVMILVLVLTPEEWFAEPIDLGRLALGFGISFGLSLIPAVAACVLSAARPPLSTPSDK
jgi:predicted anti-sigma-YlaC factor YlaD